MHKIKLMTDYGSFPLWGYGSLHYNLSPKDLPLSEELKQALLEWAEVYDNTIDMDDPCSAGFQIKEEEERFEKRGLELWEWLQHELGEDYLVEYFSQTKNRTLDS
ncbi:hypothetical protein POG22_15430 [Geitlerinema sp. CS-897]|nr:hypothetical protein [Geitlerinema sp. CS-897]